MIAVVIVLLLVSVMAAAWYFMYQKPQAPAPAVSIPKGTIKMDANVVDPGLAVKAVGAESILQDTLKKLPPPPDVPKFTPVPGEKQRLTTWQCALNKDGSDQGTVTIWWGHTAGDASWACSNWKSNCGNLGGCKTTYMGEQYA